MWRIVLNTILTVLVLSLAAGCSRAVVDVDQGGEPGSVVDSGMIDEAGETHATPVLSSTVAIEVLSRDLQGDDWHSRLTAARALTERADLPVPERADLLVAGLERELAQPTDDPAPGGAYLPASALTRLHVTRALSELGPDALPALREAVETASGAAREHLLIALVYTGDPEVLPQVWELVTGAADPVVRMDAARALGQVKDAAARPSLEAALHDSYVVTGKDDAGEFTLYPVREQAAAALRALGVTVERHDDGAFILGE